MATVAEALASDLVAQRATLREVHGSEAGPYRVLRTPARLHDTVAPPPVGAPRLGADTRAVLAELAGLSSAEIDALIASGAAA